MILFLDIIRFPAMLTLPLAGGYFAPEPGSNGGITIYIALGAVFLAILFAYLFGGKSASKQEGQKGPNEQPGESPGKSENNSA